jgi:hypothetical protein
MSAESSVRPALFIGSSTEGQELAFALQEGLDADAEVEVWSQGVFGLTETTLESLVLALDRFDFAALVVTPDDLSVKRGNSAPVPRDNVVFELGLFIGALGRERTFLVSDRTKTIEFPSDLAGVTRATFAPHSSGNLVAALGAASTRIRGAMKRLGLRDATRSTGLKRAARTLEEAGSDLEELVELIARSRKVELQIIAEQFGPLIGADRAEAIRRDLDELDKTLARRRDSHR